MSIIVVDPSQDVIEVVGAGGPPGPAGPTGPAGADGPAGPAGAVNLEYEGDWTARSWQEGDIAIHNGICYLCVRDTTNPPTAWPGR